jgi:adenosylmethionine-8-amino-7-oxononanoate aminotransferase
VIKHPQEHVIYRKKAHTYPIIERGQGVYLYDTIGRRYLDASAGPLAVNMGHGVKSVAEAMARQAAQVAYVHGNRFSAAALEAYSDRLAPRLPLPDPRLYFPADPKRWKQRANTPAAPFFSPPSRRR